MSTDPDFNVDADSPLLIVISGPSGAGKDTVVQRMKERGLRFHFVTTATTRLRRPNEVDGKDYLFISAEKFAKMIEADEFMEHALVYGDYKGVPKEQVRKALASGRDVVMRLDVQGAETIRRLVPEALLIFITTDSEEELISRLKERSTETPEALAIRIATTRSVCLSLVMHSGSVMKIIFSLQRSAIPTASQINMPIMIRIRRNLTCLTWSISQLSLF